MAKRYLSFVYIESRDLLYEICGLRGQRGVWSLDAPGVPSTWPNTLSSILAPKPFFELGQKEGLYDASGVPSTWSSTLSDH